MTAWDALRSLKLPNWGSLISAHASCGNLRLVVILSAHGRARQAAQHRDLAYVRERIGYRALEKLLSGLMQRIAGRQVGIECFKSREQAPDFRIPRKGR